MEKLREGVVIDPAEVEAYLAHLRELGRTAGTLETYRRSYRGSKAKSPIKATWVPGFRGRISSWFFKSTALWAAAFFARA